MAGASPTGSGTAGKSPWSLRASHMLADKALGQSKWCRGDITLLRSGLPMPRSTLRNRERTMARAASQCYYSQGFLVDVAAAPSRTQIGAVLGGRDLGTLYAGATLGFLVTATHFLHDVAGKDAPSFAALVEGRGTNRDTREPRPLDRAHPVERLPRRRCHQANLPSRLGTTGSGQLR